VLRVVARDRPRDLAREDRVDSFSLVGVLLLVVLELFPLVLVLVLDLDLGCVASSSSSSSSSEEEDACSLFLLFF
jgi:hypothetical protein